ncbi:MAG: transporter substrate-binding domain-containing protein [Robiginitalea sp.]|uniref:transporter substrate-binding domain-containing protein n=1 Tax=Robiginitalea sp. TaxID=1902411 RepID=UPI003C75D59D
MRFMFCIALAGLFSTSLFGVSAKDTLIVGYSEAPPFAYEEGGKLDGLNYRIWEELMEEGSYDYKYVSFSYKELLLALENGTIDVAITPLSITAAREAKFQFTTPYYASHGAVAVSVPSAWQKLGNSFRGLMNSNFLKGIFILILVIFFFGVVGWYFEWRDNTEHLRKGIAGVWDGVWWSAVTLTTVGYGDKAPKTVLGKIAALLLMFGGLVFISGLTAGIASNVAANEISNDFSALNHFKSVKVGTVTTSQIHDYLKTHFFKDVEVYSSLEEGLMALARNDIKGFMFDEEILRSEINLLALDEKLQILPIHYDAKFYGFGISNAHDSLPRILSKGIMKMRDDTDWQMLLHEYGLSDFNQ